MYQRKKNGHRIEILHTLDGWGWVCGTCRVGSSESCLPKGVAQRDALKHNEEVAGRPPSAPPIGGWI